MHFLKRVYFDQSIDCKRILVSPSSDIYVYSFHNSEADYDVRRKNAICLNENKIYRAVSINVS